MDDHSLISAIVNTIEHNTREDQNNNNNGGDNPKLVITLSGKRKSGKDHIANIIVDYLKVRNKSHLLAVLRIGEPIKRVYAERHNLRLEKLLDSTAYKEDYRRNMVEWSQDHRRKNGMNCFLQMSIEHENAYAKPIWLLTDARRFCDLEFFESLQQNQKPSMLLFKLRITCDDETRTGRGWTYVEGIDDQETECGLDTFDRWTHKIENNVDNNHELIINDLESVLNEIFAICDFY